MPLLDVAGHCGDLRTGQRVRREPVVVAVAAVVDFGPVEDDPLPDDGTPEVASIARALGYPLDGEPYRYRSARLRHLNPGGSRPAERSWSGPDDEPPDGDGEPLPEAT